MRFIQRFFSAISIALLAVSLAHATNMKGPGYSTLPEPQPTDSGKKVEVLEFFMYSCPHCFSLEPTLAAWVKKQGDAIVFKRVPIAFRDNLIPHQKLYYALEVLGKTEQLHNKVFDAIHKERQRLDSDAAIGEFVAKNGLDKAKFMDAYNSFSVQTKVSRATKMMSSYRIDGVPMLIIDGRYVTSPAKLGEVLGNVSENELVAATTKVMDELVAKSKK